MKSVLAAMDSHEKEIICSQINEKQNHKINFYLLWGTWQKSKCYLPLCRIEIVINFVQY